MPSMTPFENWRVRTKLIVITLPFIALVTMLEAGAVYVRETASLERKLAQRAQNISTQIMADRKYYTSVVLPRAVELGGRRGRITNISPVVFLCRPPLSVRCRKSRPSPRRDTRPISSAPGPLTGKGGEGPVSKRGLCPAAGEPERGLLSVRYHRRHGRDAVYLG